MMIERLPTTAVMFEAVGSRDVSFEGVFWFGVRTTGVFCRPGCSARTPRPEHVEYFAAVRHALAAGYRPCLRCRPLESKDAPPAWLRDLLAAVDAAPTERWTDHDLRARGVDPTRVRRWFVRQHGMSFHAYQRARRLGVALGRLRLGADVGGVGYGVGFESASGFRAAFAQWFGGPPGERRDREVASVTRLGTPLGPMLAAATPHELLLLEFADRRALATQIARVRRLADVEFVPGEGPILAETQRELDEYFAGLRVTFDVPIRLCGSAFQCSVWRELQTIPYGQVRSYGEQAAAIGKPSAQRAVGRANGDNCLAIVVPCHRVLGADGQLTGYGGQLWRKRALLDLERRADVIDDVPKHAARR